MPRRRAQLVRQHLENVSRSVLAKYPDIVRSFARGRNGIYALYRKDRLYYVGLATKLQQRLKQHLHDQHSQTWDRFSLYLTIGDQHLHEIESLFLRISKPRGNTVTPGFVRSANLLPDLRREIRGRQAAELEEIAPGKRSKEKKPRKVKAARIPSGKQPALARYVTTRLPIRFVYKGKVHRATVLEDGTIFGHGGQRFASPSSAARAVTGRRTYGWQAWRYERAPGDWVKLDEIRR